MKVREWARAAEPLHEVLPDFRPMRFGLVQEGEWLAKGMYADSSSFRGDRFSINAFVLPLFIPTEHLNLTYGFRIGGQWQRVDDLLVSAVAAAAPRLDALATLPALADAAHSWRVNIRHAELRLCIALLNDDEPPFRDFAEVIAGWHPQQAWEAEVMDRSVRLATTEQTQGRAAAQAELASRRDSVLKVLA